MACENLSHLKKFNQRPSPPYSAQSCPHKTMKGNDGNLWTSIPNVKGVFRWNKNKKSKSRPKGLQAKPRAAVKKAKTSSSKGRGKKTIHSMTVAETKQFPPANKLKSWSSRAGDLPIAKEYFGPKVQHLTMSIAKELVGQTVPVLWGQGWMDHKAATKRKKAITMLKIKAIDVKEKEVAVKIQKDGFEFNLYTYVGHLVSGSGADPAFVFLK